MSQYNTNNNEHEWGFYKLGTPDGMFPKTFGFIMYSSDKEPIESIWKGEAKLKR